MKYEVILQACSDGYSGLALMNSICENIGLDLSCLIISKDTIQVMDSRLNGKFIRIDRCLIFTKIIDDSQPFFMFDVQSLKV